MPRKFGCAFRSLLVLTCLTSIVHYKKNTQHSDGHSDGQYFRRFFLTTFRRDTDETYNFMFVGISSEISDEIPTKVRSSEISDKIPTEYYNFGVWIGIWSSSELHRNIPTEVRRVFDFRRNVVGIFRRISDETNFRFAKLL